MPILDLSDAPDNPIKRVAYLHELDLLIRAELYDAFRDAYYLARQQGLFDYALAVGPFSRNVAERMTREANEALGRTIRWHAVQPPDPEQAKAARRFAKKWRAAS